MAFVTGDAPLYGEIVGPLTTPRRVLEAIVEGRADVGPQDSFAFALMQRHAPELTDGVRIVASTAPMPMPALMASRGADPGVVSALRAALLAIGTRGDQAPLLTDLCISGFAALDPASYSLSERWAEEAQRGGYSRIR